MNMLGTNNLDVLDFLLKFADETSPIQSLQPPVQAGLRRAKARTAD
jgi:hypothetical protein